LNAYAPFQSTPPRGGRPSAARNSCGSASFNPRPREGGDLRVWTRTCSISCFNPRPREGGDPSARANLAQPKEFQSTPPRGGRREHDEPEDGHPNVSIHAPARGATRERFLAHLRQLVSIHAPARGATTAPIYAQAVRLVSIHAPARGATPGPQHRGVGARVSIHAPARGATSSLPDWSVSDSFQSTPPRGGRLEISGRGRRDAHSFNPRPREGGDGDPVVSRVRGERFNPRPREGGDRRRPARPSCPRVSIHAPARGATVVAVVERVAVHVSIHAPARGATSASR